MGLHSTPSIPPLATQAQAAAGTNNTARMSPLRTAEAIAALAAPGGGGGKVLQVVFASKTSIAGGSSAAWTEIGLSASITPTSTSSRILVIAVLTATAHNSSSVAIARIVNGVTPLLQADANGSSPRGHGVFVGFGGTNMIGSVSMMAEHSPGSVSSQTYSVECASVNSSIWYINRSVADSGAPQVPRGASSLILVEIGA